MANILYIGDGDPSSTSAHRLGALRRLGHSVELQDPYLALSTTLGLPYMGAVHFRTGYRLVQLEMVRWIKRVIQAAAQPDVIWVNSGELLGARCLKLLQQFARPIILYNNDDPTGTRDGHRWDSLLKALPAYNLVFVVRPESVVECQALGVKQVMRGWRGYDEVVHQPFEHASDIPPNFQSDVAFIGTWMRHEKRDEFMLHLLQNKVPISIWGERWEKSPHWQSLRAVHRGGALGGRAYTAAIQGAKICLGMLSKGNRDLRTRRSLEVPFAGGLLCAERTSEHQKMYQEGVESVFWSSAEECAQVCQELLADNPRRERIRLAGMARVRALHAGNEDVCRRILDAIGIA